MTNTNTDTNTDWEVIERYCCSKKECPEWRQHPCIAINKTNITFNEKFFDLFIKESTTMLVMVSVKDNKLGFKMVPKGEYDHNAYNIMWLKNRGHSRSITNNKIRKVFPDTVGKMYRAFACGNIIEVDLCVENEV